MSKFLIIETQANSHDDPGCELLIKREIQNLFGTIQCSNHLTKNPSFFEQAQKADKLYAALERAQKLIDDFCHEQPYISNTDNIDTIKGDAEYILEEYKRYQKHLEGLRLELTILL